MRLVFFVGLIMRWRHFGVFFYTNEMRPWQRRRRARRNSREGLPCAQWRKWSHPAERCTPAPESNKGRQAPARVQPKGFQGSERCTLGIINVGKLGRCGELHFSPFVAEHLPTMLDRNCCENWACHWPRKSGTLWCHESVSQKMFRKLPILLCFFFNLAWHTFALLLGQGLVVRVF